VRDVRLVNLSLLVMWRYGHKVGDLVEGGVGGWPSSASRWWKDLVSLAKGEEVDWFNVEIERRVGSGATTSFWKVTWRGRWRLWPNIQDCSLFQTTMRRRFETCGFQMQMEGLAILVGGMNYLCGRIIFSWNFWRI